MTSTASKSNAAVEAGQRRRVGTTTTTPIATEAVLPPSWDDLLGTVAIVDSAHASPPVPVTGRLAPAPAIEAEQNGMFQPETESFQPEKETESLPPETESLPTETVSEEMTLFDPPSATHESAPHARSQSFDPSPVQVDAPEVSGSPSHQPVAFRAAWEVDAFEVPQAVANLFFESSIFEDLGERMADAVAGGLGNLLVTSVTEGEGRSTVAIGMALAAASRNLRVALVDCDVECPDLMDQLRLDIDNGWSDFTRRGLSLAEVAVHAVDDHVTFFPLMLGEGQGRVDASEAIQLLECLSDAFDLVILDGPVQSSRILDRLVATIDSAVIVRDVQRTSTDRLNAFSYRLKEAGVRGVGAVENFTRDAA